MARSQTFFILIATLMLTGMLSIACDSGTQEPAADSAEATSPLDPTDEPTAESDDSAAIDGEEVIPEAFPEDVPIYPGSTAAQGKGAVLDGTPIAAIQLQTKDSPDEVYEFYADKFTREGWTIESGKALKDKKAISATNGKCTASMLAAPSEDGGTDVFIITEC
jgi:hypothetical protein